MSTSQAQQNINESYTSLLILKKISKSEYEKRKNIKSFSLEEKMKYEEEIKKKSHEMQSYYRKLSEKYLIKTRKPKGDL